jgi:hypothetical protein
LRTDTALGIDKFKQAAAGTVIPAQAAITLVY